MFIFFFFFFCYICIQFLFLFLGFFFCSPLLSFNILYGIDCCHLNFPFFSLSPSLSLSLSSAYRYFTFTVCIFLLLLLFLFYSLTYRICYCTIYHINMENLRAKKKITADTYSYVQYVCVLSQFYFDHGALRE